MSWSLPETAASFATDATTGAPSCHPAPVSLWLMTWRPLPDPEGPPLRRIGEDLDVLVRRFGAPGGAKAAAVFTRWADAVGDAVASHATPLSLRGTTLVVGVDAPAYATQLRMLTPQLLARLADLAGPGVVDAVEVRVRG